MNTNVYQKSFIERRLRSKIVPNYAVFNSVANCVEYPDGRVISFCDCGCGGYAMLNEYVAKLYHFRYSNTIKGYLLSSLYRCVSENKREGGATNSHHLFGDAIDIFYSTHHSLYELVKLVKSLPFSELIIYSNFIHVAFNPFNSKEKDIIFKNCSTTELYLKSVIKF